MADRELIPDFEARLRELADAWSLDDEVAAAYLHGSRARGDARPGSDVDLAVILEEGLSASRRWNKRLTLIDDAVRQFSTDAVDLIVIGG